MSVENIKNPSVTEDALALGLDSSGNIVSISGHYLAGGGGGGGISYSGRNGVSINGSYIELETSAKNAVDAVAGISTDVGTLKTASANWNKVSDKLDTTAAAQTYLEKATYASDSATFALKTQLDDYATKDYANNASANAFSEAKSWVGQQGYLSAVPDTYALKTDIPTTVAQLTDSGNYYKKTETSSTGELDTAFGSKQDNLTQEQLSAISSVSSIKGTILTGDSNILAASSESGTNILWTLQLTAQPTVTDTTLSGYDGIVATKDSSVTSQWNVGIAQAYKEQIESVSSKLTKASADTLYAPNSVTDDVDTLKSSSGDWDKVSDKLDTTAFSTVSGKFLTAHQSLDDYYTKTQVDSTFASATQLNDYLTIAKYGADSATFALKTETSSKTEITNALNTKLDSTAAAQTYQTKSDMANYLTTSDAATTYQPKGNYASASDISDMATQTWVGQQGFYTKASGDNDYAPISITSTVNTLTAASAGWNEVSAKLGSAQYANDSATFVTKPDTAQTVLNNNYLIYSTLTGAGTTTGWLPLSANYYSKSESDGRYAKASAALTSVSANTPLSGNGTTANPLGIDLTNAYTIDGTNGITAVPNSTTNKVVVQMTNDVWTDTQVVHSSISAWNEVSGLSAKSTVSANTATNVISISANSTATTANISATTYYTNTADSNLAAQRLFVVHNDTDLVAHVQAGLCQGQGSLFFVMSGFNS